MEKQLFSQLQFKREKMHAMYEAKGNLQDEKVLEVSFEIDDLINEIMKNAVPRKKNHPF